MDQFLRKFVPRSPRYILRPNDRHLVRYASEHANGPLAVHTTEMLNISETGMAIIAHPQASPRVGDRIKIELPIPGNEQIAWWGRIARVELYRRKWWASHQEQEEEERVIIGVRFEDLPDGHRRAIRRGLHAKLLEAMRERRHQQWLYVVKYANDNWLRLAIYAGATLIAAALLYWLSRPGPNYDPVKGAPWGHRFKSLDFIKNEKSFDNK